MVGVPHSTGCSRCISRRIKCDESLPNCSQCTKYGSTCPGYQKTFKFQDERPALERKHQSTPSKSSENENENPNLPEAAAAVRDNALAMMQQHVSGVSLNENFVLSLAQQACVAQQPQIFADFIKSAFPTMYFHNRFRATDRLDFLAYIMQNFGTYPYLDATVCCLSSAYLAYLTGDPEKLKVSRQMYANALSEVVRALHTDQAMSDHMLATIIMLSVYEMYARTSKGAYVVHADGVKRMMLSRGAQAHESGFAHSCYIAFRGFLIATAVYEGKPCFLEGEEWQRLSRKVGVEDSKKPGELSTFVDVSESIFTELVKLPGYLCEVQEIYKSSSPRAIAGLVPIVRRTNQRLTQLTTELKSLIMSTPAQTVPETGPSLLLQGADSAIAALKYLLGWLEVRAGSQADQSGKFARPFSIVSELDRGLSKASDNEPQDVTWLDRVASSMGMLGIQIVTDER